MENKKTLQFYGGKKSSLIPLFLLVGFAIFFFTFARVYDVMALAVGGIIALGVGSFFSKDINSYWNAAIKGMAGELGNTITLILLFVGIFGKMMVRGHIAEGFMWIGDIMNITGSTICTFTFVACSIIATATGTSFGTILTMLPLLLPAGILMGANPTILVGAVISGALFGDSIGPVSDVTIASSQTQEFNNKSGLPDIGGVVKARIKYSLAAGLIALILFWVLGSRGAIASAESAKLIKEYADPKGLVMLIPMVVLLIVAFKTKSIFIAATAGIITGSIVGLVSGVLVPTDIISVQDGALGGFIFAGLNGMVGTVLFVYALVAMIGILTECGMMDSIISTLLKSKLAQSIVGTELIIAFGSAITCLLIGSINGPACLMFGPVANELGKKANLHPYRRANLIACFTSTLPVLNPISSVFIILALGSINGLAVDYPFVEAISPMGIPAGMFFCFIFPLVFLFSIFTGWGREYEDENGNPIKTLSK